MAEKTEVETDVTPLGDSDGEDFAELDGLFANTNEADAESAEDLDDESTPAEEAGEAVSDPKDVEAQPGESDAEEPVAEAPVEKSLQEEPAVQQSTEEPSPAPEVGDPEQILADYEKWRSDAETLLAERHYNLTQEQADEFDADPGAAIPKLAAKLHMEVMQQSVAMVAGMIPQIMQNVTAVQANETAREQEFFAEWPELKEHRDQVVKLGAIYVQMNPQATFEEFKRDVGAQVAVSQRVDLSGRQSKPKETSKMSAHKPISAGGGSGAPAPQVKPGVFEELFADAEAFELG